MSLADHWDGGDYLGVGDHRCTVSKFRMFSAKTGTPGVEFTLRDSRGKEIGLGLYLTEKAMGRLASFAKACGMSREEAARYNPAKQDAHNVMLNREVMVRVEKNERDYSEVAEWWKVGEDAPKPYRQPQPAPQAQPASDYGPPVTDEDVPF